MELWYAYFFKNQTMDFKLAYTFFMFSTVILSILLMQGRQFSVSGKRMCTPLENHLETKLAQ